MSKHLTDMRIHMDKYDRAKLATILNLAIVTIGFIRHGMLQL